MPAEATEEPSATGVPAHPPLSALSTDHRYISLWSCDLCEGACVWGEELSPLSADMDPSNTRLEMCPHTHTHTHTHTLTHTQQQQLSTSVTPQLPHTHLFKHTHTHRRTAAELFS